MHLSKLMCNVFRLQQNSKQEYYHNINKVKQAESIVFTNMARSC